MSWFRAGRGAYYYNILKSTEGRGVAPVSLLTGCTSPASCVDKSHVATALHSLTVLALQGVRIWKHARGGSNGMHTFQVETAGRLSGKYYTIVSGRGYYPYSRTGYLTYSFKPMTSKYWGFNIMKNNGHPRYTSARFVQLLCRKPAPGDCLYWRRGSMSLPQCHG